MNRPKWQAIGVLLAVFALGAVTGGGALAAWQGSLRRDGAQFMWAARGGRPMQAMMRRLGLTPEQRKAIEGLATKHAPKREALMQDMLGKCGQALAQDKAELDEAIRAILTPTQRVQFDDLSTRQRERMFGHKGAAGSGRGH